MVKPGKLGPETAAAITVSRSFKQMADRIRAIGDALREELSR